MLNTSVCQIQVMFCNFCTSQGTYPKRMACYDHRQQRLVGGFSVFVGCLARICFMPIDAFGRNNANIMQVFTDRKAARKNNRRLTAIGTPMSWQM